MHCEAASDVPPAKKQRTAGGAAATAGSLGGGGRLKVPKAIADYVQWLNDNVELAMPLRLGAVARPLVELGKDVALELLAGLVEDAPGVEDPNSWVIEAAKFIQNAQAEEPDPSGEVPAEAEAEAEAEVAWGCETSAPEAEGTRRGGAEGAERGEALRMLEALNASGELMAPIKLEDLEAMYTLLGREEGLAIVRDFRQCAKDVEKPTGWLLKAGRQKLGKVAAHILRASENEQLVGQIAVRSASDILKDLPEGSAVWMLQRMQEMNWAEMSSKPMNWLRKQAKSQRAALADKAKKHEAKQSPAAGNLSEGVLKKINWLNEHKGYATGLDVERLRGPLCSVSQSTQADVLRSLKEAGGVEDPNAFVVKECRKARKQAVKAQAPSAGVPLDAGLSEGILKKVTWLNKNGGLAAPLDLHRLSVPLSLLSQEKQAEVLMLLRKGATEIEDPNSFVVKECRKARGKSRKRRKTGAEEGAEAGAEGAEEGGADGAAEEGEEIPGVDEGLEVG